MAEIRQTKQRQIILNELKKVKSHPSAYDIYNMVRDVLPNISLGTVYRNLDFLSSSGDIRKLDFVPGQKRFDGDISEHDHIRCVKCGRVDDLPKDNCFNFEKLKEVTACAEGYDVLGFNMELYGLCPECLNKKKIKSK